MENYKSESQIVKQMARYEGIVLAIREQTYRAAEISMALTKILTGVDWLAKMGSQAIETADHKEDISTLAHELDEVCQSLTNTNNNTKELYELLKLELGELTLINNKRTN